MAPSNIDDPEMLLAQSAKQGDSAAAAELIARYFDYWLRAAHGIVGSTRAPSDAADLVQDANLKLLELWRTGEGPDTNVRSYVTAMMRNAHLNRLRSPRSRELDVDDLGAADIPLSEDDYRRIEISREAQAVRRALAALAPDHQTVLRAVLVDGRKPADLTTELGRQAPAVSSLLLRAKHALHRSLLIEYLSTGGEQCAANAHALPKRVHEQVDAHRPHDAGLAHVLQCEDCQKNWRRFGHVSTALGVVPLVTIAVLAHEGATVPVHAVTVPNNVGDGGATASGGSAASAGVGGSAATAGIGASGAAAGSVTAGAAGSAAAGAGGAAVAGAGGVGAALGGGAVVAGGSAAAAGAAAAVTGIGAKLVSFVASKVVLVGGIALVVVAGTAFLASVLTGHTTEQSVVDDDAAAAQQSETVETANDGSEVIVTLPTNDFGAELDVRLDLDANNALLSISTEFGVAGAAALQLHELTLSLSPGVSWVSVSNDLQCGAGASSTVCVPGGATDLNSGVVFGVNDAAGSGSFTIELVAEADGDVFTGSATGNW
ncbi:MAG: sigma-70 family RNA polymerase sigma factor [Leucobacter sp.]|nr:sigma-70 family RNA polymerase sigma factor [Leucobacter sp.]